MGLAASQARLLTITARKSDCEAQSMRYSHQKIALSRDLVNLSNEYQNSLDQTKLVYDFYGTGDETTLLNYGLMMTPSEMNGYLPMMITDAAGKTVLSSQYAAAARAAGIPQEGLGTLPSSDVRNKFIQGLADSGLMSQESANIYMGIQYSQAMGNGTTDLVEATIEQMTLAELLEYYESGEAGAGLYKFDLGAAKDVLNDGNGKVNDVYIMSAGEASGGNSNRDFTLSSILSGDYNLLVKANYETKQNDCKVDEIAANIKNLGIWEWMFDEFEAMLNVPGDSNIAAAIEYARAHAEDLLDSNALGLDFSGKCKEKDYNGWSGVINAMNQSSGISQDSDKSMFGSIFGGQDEGRYSTSDFIGITVYRNDRRAYGVFGLWDNKRKKADGISINISNIAKAYLTYFSEMYLGLMNVSNKYSVDSNIDDGRRVSQSSLVGLDDKFMKFDIVTSTGVNADQALLSGFYDAVFNQICLRGWTENNQVQDSNYMQEMLKTGKFFLATCGDDGYYYQGGYSTNTYVREITDDDAIARAEARYNTEKQKLNQKEEMLDLKMKNLDTEISSLTTEYDTVKSVISKNIEKSFKRYDA